MLNTLTTPTKVTMECRATGESTYQLFCRAFRDVNKQEPKPPLIVQHVKAFIRDTSCPSYVYEFFAQFERRRA